MKLFKTDSPKNSTKKKSAVSEAVFAVNLIKTNSQKAPEAILFNRHFVPLLSILDFLLCFQPIKTICFYQAFMALAR